MLCHWQSPAACLLAIKARQRKTAINYIKDL
jgi:hypothetical protein